MTAKDPLFKVVCFLLCVATSMSSHHEESRSELIDHVLRIPNPDRVLNSVLGRLERHRLNDKPREATPDEVDCWEPLEGLPEYTESIQISKERGQRQLDAKKFYPICHLERKLRRLNTNEYEYRPAYYEEVKCSTVNDDNVSNSNEICSSLGFSCVQWNKTIHLTRRRYSSDCWETRTMVIPAGCECMWPFHRLGDMSLHL